MELLISNSDISGIGIWDALYHAEQVQGEGNGQDRPGRWQYDHDPDINVKASRKALRKYSVLSRSHYILR